MNDAVTILDDRPDMVPFLLQVGSYKSIDDMVFWMNAKQGQGQIFESKPFVLGLTTEQAYSLSPRELAERHGILLIRLRSESEEGTIFQLAQRIDLFHQHALSMTRRDAKGELDDAADHIVMRTGEYKNRIQMTTGMDCADYLEARGAVRGCECYVVYAIPRTLPSPNSFRDGR
jgi:hypothetical protein